MSRLDEKNDELPLQPDTSVKERTLQIEEKVTSTRDQTSGTQPTTITQQVATKVVKTEDDKTKVETKTVVVDKQAAPIAEVAADTEASAARLRTMVHVSLAEESERRRQVEATREHAQRELEAASFARAEAERRREVEEQHLRELEARCAQLQERLSVSGKK